MYARASRISPPAIGRKRPGTSVRAAPTFVYGFAKGPAHGAMLALLSHSVLPCCPGFRHA
ncbi:hypothetical protein CSC45_5493 [Pseudomonas aeruginosa]|nr:hypothetical protein CSC45_5493 [Pseudomonas aeruginosa]